MPSVVMTMHGDASGPQRDSSANQVRGTCNRIRIRVRCRAMQGKACAKK